MEDIGKKKSLEFLLNDYTQMFNEKRYLDARFTRSISLYFTIITISVSIAAIAFELESELCENITPLLICIFFLISIFGYFIVLSMRYNRKNYVRTLRQINAIRNYCLKGHEFSKHNLMDYSILNPPYFKRASTHLKFMRLIIALNSLFAAISLYLFLSMHILSTTVSIMMPIAAFISSLLFQMHSILYYLKKCDKEAGKSANK